MSTFGTTPDQEKAKGRSRSRSPDRNRQKPRLSYAQRAEERKAFKPNLTGCLLSFKQFMELQHFPLDPFEAQKHYDEYKASHEKKHMEIFFNDHIEDHWFLEKYDPIVSQKWQEERFLNAKISHQRFLETMRSQNFEGLLLKDTGASNTDKITGPPHYGFDPNSMTLSLNAIPVNVSRWDLLSVVKTSPGFISLSLSEPSSSHGFSRLAWVIYDTEEHCNQSLELLADKTVCGDFKLSPVRSQSSGRTKVQVAALQPPEALKLDWKQSRRLILCLDREKGITENYFLNSEDSFLSLSEGEQEFQLDLQILYLRKVHAFCYYCLEEYEDEHMLAVKCGLAHIRSRFDPSATRSPQFDTNVEKRLSKIVKSVKYDRCNDEELTKLINEFEERNAVQEEEQKVRCNLCNKLFRGSDFTKKHIQNRHTQEVNQVFQKRIRALTFENYLMDPRKMTNQNYPGEHVRQVGRPTFKKIGNDASFEGVEKSLFNAKCKRKIVDYSDL